MNTSCRIYEVLDGRSIGLGVHACEYHNPIPQGFNGFQALETFPDGVKTYLVAAESQMIAKRKVLECDAK